MEKEMVQPIYDSEKNLKFLKRTKNGEFAEIEKSSFKYIRMDIGAQHIDTDAPEYYYSYYS